MDCLRHHDRVPPVDHHVVALDGDEVACIAEDGQKLAEVVLGTTSGKAHPEADIDAAEARQALEHGVGICLPDFFQELLCPELLRRRGSPGIADCRGVRREKLADVFAEPKTRQ